jgi:hypothetical protein
MRQSRLCFLSCLPRQQSKVLKISCASSLPIKIAGVGPHFVVKYGLQIDLAEGRNMVYIGETTSVPVPRFYALFKDPIGNKKYIIMERVAGTTLDGVWASLHRTQEEAILAKNQDKPR